MAMPPPSLTNSASRQDSLYQTFGGISSPLPGTDSLLEQMTPLLLGVLAVAALWLWKRG